LEASLKRLIGLQECDTRIRELRNKREQGPMRIQKLQEEFEQSESQLSKELDRLEAYKRERRRIEREIEDPESKIHKSKIKLDNIKSNKEYKAVLKELADLAREKSLLEDQALEVMEQIEDLEKECEASKAKRTELKEKYEKEREAILKELQSVDEALELLEPAMQDFFPLFFHVPLDKLFHVPMVAKLPAQSWGIPIDSKFTIVNDNIILAHFILSFTILCT